MTVETLSLSKERCNMLPTILFKRPKKERRFAFFTTIAKNGDASSLWILKDKRTPVIVTMNIVTHVNKRVIELTNAHTQSV